MKNIILLSDGTGNSASALTKTNVWRLYQALDLKTAGPDGTTQIAMYDDGVGTSGFRPLALLGGAFGWGLKRNVLELYGFLCRNYRPGDRIFAFGFSRGAFTVRVLVALVISQGLVEYTTDAAFRSAARQCYRNYRKRLGNQTMSPLIPLVRWVRDRTLDLWRARPWPHASAPPMLTQPKETRIAFLGAWDTVAAYGLPSAELTAGFDQVVWPLSMPNYRLSPNVDQARHALALDDERDSFHPLLWDEVAEREMIQAGEVKPDRLRQVWFAGMHADVGGGYPDDGIAMVPLLWMVGEAKAAGLRFIQPELDRYAAQQGLCAPMHDSRRGVSGYYRYQPRRIDAWTEAPATASLLMRDPRPNMRASLTAVKVHHSVIARIDDGADHYAPIVLPARIEVVDAPADADLTAVNRSAERDMEAQEHIWNDVWRKRVNYYAMVAVSAFLAAFPLLPASYTDGTCDDWLCSLAWMITAAGSFLPGFLDTWIEAFARNPDLFTVSVVAIALLMWRSAILRARIQDRMGWIWQDGGSGKPPPPRDAAGMTDGLIERIRMSSLYQGTLRTLKWRILPLVFGYALLATAITTPVWVYYRTQLATAEASGEICKLDTGAQPVKDKDLSDSALFTPNAPCWDTGLTLKAGREYRVVMQVTAPWLDDSRIAASPLGFNTSEFNFFLRPITLLAKRSYEGKWFQPFVTLVNADNTNRVSLPLEMKAMSDGTYEARFEAPINGRMLLWVNDAVIGPTGLTGAYYRNNVKGSARVSITPL